ncbi:MAG TPA: signal peptide peptidase SppA [Patescibacteria group bacterium]|nr:signal peptide peptidase SppA [Patescibacteria group bacterium]
MAENIPPFPGNPNNPTPPPPPSYYPYYQPRKRSRWWIPLVIIGGIFVGIIAIFIGFFALLGSAFSNMSDPVNVRANSVLTLNFSKIQEQPEQNPFSAFGGGSDPVSLLNAIEAIRYAKTDNNIKGIYFKANGSENGFAIAKELQDALVDFKKSGKFIYSFIETGNENDYYFSMAADSIFMPREGLMEMNGFGASAIFFKGLFDKLGIDWYVQQFEEYKSAGEMFNRTNFSAPAREEMRAIVEQRHSMFVSDAIRLRPALQQTIAPAIQRGIYMADSLKDLGFVDAIASEGDVRERMESRIFKNSKPDNSENDDEKNTLRTISLTKYIDSEGFKSRYRKDNSAKTIAIVYGSGAIQSGDSKEVSIIASDTFVENLKKARENKNVAAVLIRINSPGGSVIASDAIYEEIIKTRKEKPVYASMSDVAASGGYYMAAACDTIIAHPATITGSIGVILSIPNATKAMEKIGVSVDTVTTSPAATFLNPMMPFQEKDKQKLYSMSSGIYYRFLEKVAQSRGKSVEEIRTVARGRVWTGEAAKNVGLVDALGGLQESISLLKSRIGVAADQRVNIEIYPKKKDEITVLLNMFGLDKDTEDDAEANTGISAFVQKYYATTPMWYAAWQNLPKSVRGQITYASQMAAIGEREPVVMAMPYLFEIR